MFDGLGTIFHWIKGIFIFGIFSCNSFCKVICPRWSTVKGIWGRNSPFKSTIFTGEITSFFGFFSADPINFLQWNHSDFVQTRTLGKGKSSLKVPKGERGGQWSLISHLWIQRWYSVQPSKKYASSTLYFSNPLSITSHSFNTSKTQKKKHRWKSPIARSINTFC